MARDPLITCGWLLANTTTLTLATGIANIYVRDAFATVNAQNGLAEQSGGRFDHARCRGIRGCDRVELACLCRRSRRPPYLK